MRPVLSVHEVCGTLFKRMCEFVRVHYIGSDAWAAETMMSCVLYLTKYSCHKVALTVVIQIHSSTYPKKDISPNVMFMIKLRYLKLLHRISYVGLTFFKSVVLP